MKNLKELLNEAYKEELTEDGTVADLGPAPTGHKKCDLDDCDIEGEEK